MAYQFADGFDNYGNGYTLVAGYPWASIGPATATINTADSRFTPPSPLLGGCLTFAGGGQNYARQNLSSNQATLIVGVGFKSVTLPPGYNDFIGFWDAGTMQLSLTLSSTGALQFYRGTSVALGSPSAPGTISAGTWYGIQVQVTINGSTGSVACYLNGSVTPLITASGLNTQVTANAYANQVSIGSNGGSGVQPAWHFDDFFCFDNTGGTLNSVLGGDARILTKMPSGAGTYTNWTPTGLASNWQNAAVVPPSTSDYNANNVATTKDSYAMPVANLAVAPYFVVARASLERDDAGPHTPSLFVRSGTTDSTGVVTPALSASYLFYDAVFQTDPSTGVAWTGPGIDNAQAGVIEG